MATPAFADRPVKFKAFTIGEVVKLKKKGARGKKLTANSEISVELGDGKSGARGKSRKSGRS